MSDVEPPPSWPSWIDREKLECIMSGVRITDMAVLGQEVMLEGFAEEGEWVETTTGDFVAVAQISFRSGASFNESMPEPTWQKWSGTLDNWYATKARLWFLASNGIAALVDSDGIAIPLPLTNRTFGEAP